MRHDKREMWRMGMGTTFFPQQYSGRITSHLMIIISDPQKNAAEIALVHLTSLQKDETADLSCTFKSGEHPAIYKPCYVKYDAAQIRSTVELTMLLDSGFLHVRELMPDEPLKRMQHGAILSDRTPIRIREILKEQGLA